MPTDSSSVSVIRESYASLKEDVLGFKQKGRVVLLGDFNARVGRSMDVEDVIGMFDDVIGMFGEDTCKFISFFNEMELVICNGRQLVLEPEWTRVRPSFDQKSVIDFIVTDVQLMRESGEVIVDSTDIGVSDHLLVWLELGRVAKCCRKQKRTIRKWRLDRFAEDEVKGKYCQALRAEVESFSESIREKVVQGTRGRELVSEVLEDWESIVNRVAKAEVGEKVVVCGRAARWWDDEIKAKIEQRRELYKRILRGEDGLWEEYVRLRKEVKQLVTEKKLQIRNEVVDKANSDYEGNKKEFWGFVSRRRKGKKKGIVALRNSAGVSVTSTKGKLEVLKTHYRQLGSCSVDSAFDDSWKEEVDEQVSECSSVSKACEDSVLDREIEREEIAVCVRKLNSFRSAHCARADTPQLQFNGVATRARGTLVRSARC